MNTEPISSSALFSSNHARYLETLSEDDFWRHASELAARSAAITSLHDEYITCQLVQGRCIVPLSALREVMPAPSQFTFLPISPTWMPGISTWQGEIVAVVDLAAYFQHFHLHTTSPPSQDISDGVRLLLMASLDGVHIGLLVTLHSYQTTLPTLQLQPLPEYVQSLTIARVLKGMHEDAFVLDIPALLALLVQHVKVVQ